jgi:uncharacterized membrane protein YfcA
MPKAVPPATFRNKQLNTVRIVIWEIVIFFVISILLSMVGMGGGVFYVPMFLFFGYDFHSASTISLFLITITGFSASIRFRKAKMVDWQLALVLETFTDLGAFAGGFTSLYFHTSVLKILLGILLIIAAGFTYKSGNKKKSNSGVKHGFGYWNRNFNGYSYSLPLFAIIPVTFLIGYLSGLLGIAGGVFKIPIMILWFGIPTKIAIATSALMVGLTGLVGLGGHLFHTPLDINTAIILGIVVFTGGQIGSRISVKLPEKTVKGTLTVILTLIGLFMIIKSTGF